MLTLGSIYFLGLLASLSVSEMTNLKIGQGQHMALALFILATSIACLRSRYLASARIVQLSGFAVVMLIHTHSHAGASWVMSYHRLLSVLALTLAALFLVLLLTANRKILTLICGAFFLSAVALTLYIEPSHTHATASSAIAVQQVQRCDTLGIVHTVTFYKAPKAIAPVSAKTCDQVLIVNETDQAVELEAGEHENHVNYPLVSDQVVAAHGSLTVGLTMAGDLKIHDHISGLAASPSLAIE